MPRRAERSAPRATRRKPRPDLQAVPVAVDARTAGGHMPDVNDWNSKTISEFRANGGKVGGPFDGAPLLLLHTTGARTGEERVTPVMYQDIGEGHIAVFATKGGMPTNPDWYHNLITDPEVTAEIGTEVRRFRARTAPSEERAPI